MFGLLKFTKFTKLEVTFDLKKKIFFKEIN